MRCSECKKRFDIKTILTCMRWSCALCVSTYKVTEESEMPHPSKNRPRKGRRKIGSKKRKARARR